MTDILWIQLDSPSIVQFDPLEVVQLWHQDSQRLWHPDFIYDRASDSNSELDLCLNGELSWDEEDEGDKDD